MALVDIILPNFNKENYLQETIDSILEQSLKDFNLFIIDDNSTDNSIKVIDKYSDPRIKFIKLKKNKGVYFCRNLGIRLSKSKYISFIDADDYWSKDKLKNQINFMNDNKYKFTYTDYIPFKIKNNVKLLKKKIIVSKEFSFEKFIYNSSIAMSTIIINRSILKNIKFKKLKICEDYLFKCEILKEHDAFKCENATMFYRISKNSLQSNKIRNIYWVWYINKKYNKLNFFNNLISLILISLNSIKKYGFK
tara:strand:+ start:36 stop:785 length:750 start_codon:yes stop_codon:yes gene_type:complete